ncbi:hypothetical protein V6N12_007538 [Hibiscus sabdariffa]|uniref:F-box associated domain-containing protein n=1 Tax=Hibiscus sabdariffa TaxID=183260 RepID=A0ABR2F236_9ROSI
MGDSIGFRNLTKYTMANLLISLDLETEQFQEAPKPDCCGSDMCLCHLLVVRGCLSVGAFHENDGRLEIWVMKESWIKELSIGSCMPPTLIDKTAATSVIQDCETFKEFTFPEKPARWFKIIIHLGTLNWLEN